MAGAGAIGCPKNNVGILENRRLVLARPPEVLPMLVSIARLARETAKIVAAYRREIEDGGACPGEALALAQRLHDRLLRPVFDHPPIERQPAPWAEFEALFAAVVKLELALGHAPDAVAAVDYMSRSGLLLPEIAPPDARRLAQRVPISSMAIYSAFRVGRLLEDPDRKSHGGS